MSTIEIITPDWPAPCSVRAAVTTRRGGFSQSPFKGLNLAHHVGDDAEDVARNRYALQQHLQLLRAPLWLNQVHSGVCLDAAEAQSGMDGDGLVSAESDVVLGVMVADCLPILVCCRSGRSCAVIHAGWRGLASGIIQNTLRQFRGNDPVAWLGPAIGPCHYEVDAQVRDRFADKSAFKPGRDDAHWMMDLYVEARRQFARSGVHDVYGGEFCCYCDTRFYSFRRDGRTGRFAALIWCEDTMGITDSITC